MRCFLAALVLTLAAARASACVTSQQAFNTAFKGNANRDLNDYGRIHHDADDQHCARRAARALTEKLGNHLKAGPSTFQRWLDGFLVAEIYAAAVRIDEHGAATRVLDDRLAELATRFRPATDEPSGKCGGDEFNTCMDDLTGNASAYAWMAAYVKRRPERFSRAQLAAKIALAEKALHAALKPVSAAEPKNGICLRDKPVASGAFVPLCTGTLAELRAGRAETFSVNGQQQLLHYGFGLMTSVASAKLGLERAGSAFVFTSDERRVARALMEEAQRHFDPRTRGYDSACVARKVVQGVVTYPRVDCGGGYRPDMVALKPFYDARLDGTPPGMYQSDRLDANLFRLGDRFVVVNGVKTDTEHFSYGRYATYGVQAYGWWVIAPSNR